MNKKQLITGGTMIMFSCMMVLACKKSENTVEPATNNNTNTNISAVPSVFTQKLLIEQFTASWNGSCPDGIYRMDQLISTNSGKIIGVNIHMGDAMEIPLFNSLIAVFNGNNLPQFPSAMVNRIPSLGNPILTKTQWLSNATVSLSHTAQCGLAIKSTISGNNAIVEIHSGFKSVLSGSYRLIAYLVENNITGTGSSYNQANLNNSNDPGSPYFNKPNPITGFVHNHVVRKVITAEDGDLIEAGHIIPGGEDIKTFTVDITGKDITRLTLVAFIEKTGISSTTHEIMNVQVSGIKELKDWD